jgi:hypothetical protein
VSCVFAKEPGLAGEINMTKEQFDAAYAAIIGSYKGKMDLLEKARDAELRRLEQNFRVEVASGARRESN